MKTAIIIGASTGIGRATALALSGKYNSISITSFKHKEELLSLRDELMAKGCICYCETGDAGDIPYGDPSGVQSEAVQALTALGYSSTDALRAVRKVTDVEPTDVEGILKAALKNF